MADEPTDADLEAALAPPADHAWSVLADAARAVESGSELGQSHDSKVVGARVVGGEERPVYSMPYVDLSPQVRHLLGAIGGVGAIQPFDWMNWDGHQRFRGGHGLADAPVADSVRMTTAIVRGDRFSEGTVLTALEDGTLLAAVRRLLHWNDTRPPSPEHRPSRG